MTLSCIAGSTAAPSTCSAVAIDADSRNEHAVCRHRGWRGRRLQLQRAGSRIRHETCYAPDSRNAARSQLRDDDAIPRERNRGARNHVCSGKFPGHGRGIVQSERHRFLQLWHCERNLHAHARRHREPHFNNSGQHDGQRGCARGNRGRQLSGDTPGYDGWGPGTADDVIHLERNRQPGFRSAEPIAFPEINAGSTGTSAPISITAQDGFSGTVALTCPTTYGAGSCSISPTSVSSFPATATLTINGTSFVAGSYSLVITGTSGSITHTTRGSIQCRRLLDLRDADAVPRAGRPGHGQSQADRVDVLQRKDQCHLRRERSLRSHVRALSREPHLRCHRRHGGPHRDHQRSQQRCPGFLQHPHHYPGHHRSAQPFLHRRADRGAGFSRRLFDPEPDRERGPDHRSLPTDGSAGGRFVQRRRDAFLLAGCRPWRNAYSIPRHR